MDSSSADFSPASRGMGGGGGGEARAVVVVVVGEGGHPCVAPGKNIVRADERCSLGLHY